MKKTAGSCHVHCAVLLSRLVNSILMLRQGVATSTGAENAALRNEKSVLLNLAILSRSVSGSSRERTVSLKMITMLSINSRKDAVPSAGNLKTPGNPVLVRKAGVVSL